MNILSLSTQYHANDETGHFVVQKTFLEIHSKTTLQHFLKHLSRQGLQSSLIQVSGIPHGLEKMLLAP